MLFIRRLTESGITQGLHNTKVKNRTQSTNILSIPLTTSKMNNADNDTDDEEKENLIMNRESSHEYD